MCQQDSIEVRQLDWKDVQMNQIDDGIEIILAADGTNRIIDVFKSLNFQYARLRHSSVIYDDELTDVLFNLLMQIFHEKSSVQSIYMTIEKRINFYSSTNSVECPAYDYFLEKLHSCKITMPMLMMEEIPTNSTSIRQSTSIYQRTNELVSSKQTKKHNEMNMNMKFNNICCLSC
jgi:hypothetical protein